MCPASYSAMEPTGIHLGGSFPTYVLSPSAKGNSAYATQLALLWILFLFPPLPLHKDFSNVVSYPTMQFLMTPPLRSPTSYVESRKL